MDIPLNPSTTIYCNSNYGAIGVPGGGTGFQLFYLKWGNTQTVAILILNIL